MEKRKSQTKKRTEGPSRPPTFPHQPLSLHSTPHLRSPRGCRACWWFPRRGTSCRAVGKHGTRAYISSSSQPIYASSAKRAKKFGIADSGYCIVDRSLYHDWENVLCFHALSGSKRHFVSGLPDGAGHRRSSPQPEMDFPMEVSGKWERLSSL